MKSSTYRPKKVDFCQGSAIIVEQVKESIGTQVYDTRTRNDGPHS